jgi:hypothetical protein
MILLQATSTLCSSVSKREMLRSLTSVRSIYLSTYQNLLVETRCKVQVLFLIHKPVFRIRIIVAGKMQKKKLDNALRFRFDMNPRTYGE